MLEAKTYTFSELMEVITESSDNKPVVGKNVWKDNSQNNVKAVKDIMKQTEEFNDVKTSEKSSNPNNIEDFNKTTLDVNFAYEPSKEYKERVKAQVHGYPSAENEKLHNENKDKEQETDSLDYNGNKEFYKQNSEKQKEVSDKKTELKHAGLKSHNLSKEDYKDKNIFTNENKKMKRLTYNKEFLSESQVLKKIPDNFKVDGNKFIMADCNNVQYVIECVKDTNIDYVYTNIVKVIQPEKVISEAFEHMMKLANYNSSDYNKCSTSKTRQVENDKLSENIKRIKELMQN